MLFCLSFFFLAITFFPSIGVSLLLCRFYLMRISIPVSRVWVCFSNVPLRLSLLLLHFFHAFFLPHASPFPIPIFNGFCTDRLCRTSPLYHFPLFSLLFLSWMSADFFEDLSEPTMQARSPLFTYVLSLCSFLCRPHGGNMFFLPVRVEGRCVAGWSMKTPFLISLLRSSFSGPRASVLSLPWLKYFRIFLIFKSSCAGCWSCHFFP